MKTESTKKVSKAPTLQGVVTSNAMDKTIVVKVDTIKAHPKYQKQYRSSKKYKVHVEDSKAHEIGSKVQFIECRPMSKDKRHTIVA
jgi:small subunit ribosomal protein S17